MKASEGSVVYHSIASEGSVSCPSKLACERQLPKEAESPNKNCYCMKASEGSVVYHSIASEGSVSCLSKLACERQLPKEACYSIPKLPKEALSIIQ